MIRGRKSRSAALCQSRHHGSNEFRIRSILPDNNYPENINELFNLFSGPSEQGLTYPFGPCQHG